MDEAVHVFLTPAWLHAAKLIRDEYTGRGPALPSVRMNQVITDVPFSSETLEAHVDTTAGGLELDLGHLPVVDVTITLDYQTARAVLVDQDSAAVMQAFFSGKITVQGDISLLLSLQGALSAQTTTAGSGSGAVYAEIASRIRAVTAP